MKTKTKLKLKNNWQNENEKINQNENHTANSTDLVLLNFFCKHNKDFLSYRDDK